MLLGANRAARDGGVRPGQSVATALSRLPGLLVLPREPAREAALLGRLALATSALSPQLSLAPSGVLVEVQGSLRLFGGVRAVLHHAGRLARDSGVQARLACAPQAGAAWLLATRATAGPRRAVQAARCTRLLDRLPAEALSNLEALTPSQRELLDALGLHDLGSLRALPRAGLQRRFGPALARALDRSYGQAPEAHRWFSAPECFAVRCELQQRADDAATLCAAIETLLPALHGWLQRRWQAVVELELSLRHESGRTPPPDTRLQLRLSSPSRDMAQLALLWRERLARHVLAAPVYEIGLALTASAFHGGTAGELLPTPGRATAEQAALLDRLAARLGPDRVRQWQPVADHRPERAQQAVPAGSAPLAALAAPDASPAPPPPRPAWLLATPQPLPTDAHGLPLHDGPLRLCTRAERIEAGWFDGTAVRRDYHVAEGRDHRLRWIYREHPTGAPGAAGGWFLHGWFG